MPRKTFTPGEVLSAADVNTFLMDQSVMTFAGTAARSSAIGTATQGMVTYLADQDKFEYWAGTAYAPFGGGSASPYFELETLVIGGGGGGSDGGGGAAGGYRSATFPVGTATLAVSIGAGGAIGTTTNKGASGTSSTLGLLTSAGGGGGGGEATDANKEGRDGGSGGGGGSPSGTGTGAGGLGNTPTVSPSQGNNGGTGQHTAGVNISGGGGGGAGGVGSNASGRTGGAGGAGTSSSITGSAVTRAIGGNGASMDAQTLPNITIANTGNGGHASHGANAPLTGNSGVVILKYPSTFTITIGAGLTGSTSTVGDFKITSVTAGTGNVSWAAA